MINVKYKVVEIKGGLGAQLLSIFIIDYLKSKNYKVFSDVSYFKNKELLKQKNDSKLSFFDWQLDQYGYKISDYDTYNIGKFERKFSKIFKNKLILDGSKDRFAYLNLAINNINLHKYKKIVSYKSEEVDKIIKKYNYPIIIHFRQGDFKYLSSHFIKEKELNFLIDKMSNFNICNVVILSDQNFSFRNINYNKNKLNLFQLKLDHITSHQLMIKSKVLIISNSQFSFSAALLNKQASIFSPVSWIKKNDFNQDLILNKKSENWMMLNL